MGIRAQELRIGNLVYPFDDISLVDEKTIKRDCIFVEWKDLEDTFHLQPIPLTPEWLERFGFEYEEGFADDYTKGPISLYNNPFLEGWTVETIFSELIKKNMLNIKYVHQLQNLYFALTGQELELK